MSHRLFSWLLPWGLLLMVATVTLLQGLPDDPGLRQQLLWELRLPRLLLAWLTGAGMALSGAVVQGLYRNPLAEPALIGVSGGAALAAALVIALLSPVMAPGLFNLVLPAAAFAGGILVVGLLSRLATGEYGLSMATMLLAGIAVNALVAAGLALLQVLAPLEALRQLVFWLLGSFAYADWSTLWVLLPGCLVLSFFLLQRARVLDLLALGDSEAWHLGVDVTRQRRWMVILVALLVALLVSSVGMIGFIGLVVPHWVRLLGFIEYRRLLPLSLFWGGALMVVADYLAHHLVFPIEIPVGILTAMIGVPFFLGLLLRERQRWGMHAGI